MEYHADPNHRHRYLFDHWQYISDVSKLYHRFWKQGGRCSWIALRAGEAHKCARTSHWVSRKCAGDQIIANPRAILSKGKKPVRQKQSARTISFRTRWTTDVRALFFASLRSTNLLYLWNTMSRGIRFIQNLVTEAEEHIESVTVTTNLQGVSILATMEGMYYL